MKTPHRKPRRKPAKPARRPSRRTPTPLTSPAPAPAWSSRAAFAKIIIHVPGRAADLGLCGAIVPGMPAGDPQMWGALTERIEATREVTRELAEAIVFAAYAIRGHVEGCKGCLANLERMRVSDAKRLEGWRGRRPIGGVVQEGGGA